MESLLLLAPVFLVFELLQLVLGERYLGIRQIAADADPRELPMPGLLAFTWTAAIVGYALWMLVVLALPLGRVHAMGLLLVTCGGYILRRQCPLPWVLVALTVEGAIRIGLLVSLSVSVWRHLA